MIEVANMVYAIKRMNGDISNESTMATASLCKAGLSETEIANLKRDIYCANQKVELLNEITDLLIKVANEQFAFATLLNEMAKEVDLRYEKHLKELPEKMTLDDRRIFHDRMCMDVTKMEILEKIITEYHKGEV